jgi:hypothetical protein
MDELFKVKDMLWHHNKRRSRLVIKYLAIFATGKRMRWTVQLTRGNQEARTDNVLGVRRVLISL